MVVKFDVIAKNQLQRIYDYIKRTSIQNAEKLVNEIVERAECLAAYPEKYPLGKYKANKRWNFPLF